MKGPLALLRDSFGIFMQNPKLFIGIYLVPGLLTLAFSLITDAEIGTELTTPLSVALALALWAALIAASIFMSIAMVFAVVDPSIAIRRAFARSKPYFWQYTLLSILVSLTIFAGFVLLIVPGIIFMVWFGFSYYALLLEDVRGIEAMKRSRALVKGKWWAVFGRVAALILIGLAFGIVIGLFSTIGYLMVGAAISGIIGLIVNSVLVPVSVAYLYLMYKDLRARQETVAPAPLQEDPAVSAPESEGPRQAFEG